MELNKSRSRKRKRGVSSTETVDESAARKQKQLTDKRERARYLRQTMKQLSRSFEAGLIDINVAESTDTIAQVHDCGSLRVECKHCKAKFFASERLTKSSEISPQFGLCCGDGKIKLWHVPEPPEPLSSLLTDMSLRSRQFRCNIRRYNCALCMASMQANEVTFSHGPSAFKVHGAIYRFIGPMRHSDGQQPKCLQTFFVDAAMQAGVGIERFGSNIDADVMTDLRQMLRLNNSYVRSFVSVDEQLQSGLLPQSVSLELLANHRPSNEHRGRYNLPTSNEEIAILIPGQTRAARSIVVQPRAIDGSDAGAGLQLIPETHRSWDPLQYVLMFPYGTDGFHLDIVKQVSSEKSVSPMEYYCYRLMQRDGLNVILRGCRLFQQYVVDACAKIEQLRLNYIRFNQNNLRSDVYSGVADAVLANDGDRAGRRIVLPASFTGGARYMHRLFQDAMAIVRRYGKPHLFVTFTCNVFTGRKFSRHCLKVRRPTTVLISFAACFVLKCLI